MFPFGPQFCGGQMPFALPPTDTLGKTRYKYVTPDGGPPADGAVPTPTLNTPGYFGPGTWTPGMAGPFGSPLPAMSPFPMPPGPGLVFGAPPPYSAPPAPPRPAAVSSTAPPPPPQPKDNSHVVSHEPEPPVEGNRVCGQLAIFPDRDGYIFPRKFAMIHLFVDNIISKHAPVNNIVAAPSAKFTKQRAPLKMTIRELIEGLSCKTRANYHPPWNMPGHGYPEDQIGIQQVFPAGPGKYMLGSKICMADDQAKLEVREVWPEWNCGRQDAAPILLVRWPV